MKSFRFIWITVAAIGIGSVSFSSGQESTQKVSRVLPVRLNPSQPESVLPPLPPALPVPGMSPAVVPAPVRAPAPRPLPPPPTQLPDSVIAWDATLKNYTAKPGEMSAPFKFYFTNMSSGVVTVENVHTSCGCTAAQLPPLPWKLPAGTNSVLPVTINLAGKSGIIFKTVTFNTDKGVKSLMLKVTIPPPPPPPVAGPMDRLRNQAMAKADRQAVFKGDCARCHVEKARGKLGKDLYVAACGICHEAEHRATMVADLHAIKQKTNAEFWKIWIEHGKPGTMMPAFARSEGGPLNDWQINSLVEYLVTAFPSKVATQTAKSSAAK